VTLTIRELHALERPQHRLRLGLRHTGAPLAALALGPTTQDGIQPILLIVIIIFKTATVLALVLACTGTTLKYICFFIVSKTSAVLALAQEQCRAASSCAHLISPAVDLLASGPCKLFFSYSQGIDPVPLLLSALLSSETSPTPECLP
jgi:hypothetical protein